MSPKQMSQYDQSKKRKKMESSSKTSSPMHFFKIIQAHAIKTERLEIPTEFLKKFGRELSETAIIRVPIGPIMWSIGLTKRGAVISFEHGWPEFMEFYSIEVGHLLVFRYEGNSRFNVLIFNMGAIEIEYPTHNFRTNFKDKVEVIELDSCSSHSNNDTSTQSEYSSSSREYCQVNLETDQPADEHGFLKQRKVLADTVTGRRTRSNTSGVAQSKERAFASAEAFKSKKPFFKAFMSASCVNGGVVNVPADFANKHLKQRTMLVNLRVADGKSWDVKLIFSKKRRRAILSKGWCQFATDNQLNIGNVCVFELVDSNKINMTVHIFRVFQEKLRRSV